MRCDVRMYMIKMMTKMNAYNENDYDIIFVIMWVYLKRKNIDEVEVEDVDVLYFVYIIIINFESNYEIIDLFVLM